MKVVVLGAGISGHTAAAFLKKKLGNKHEVIVVSPSQYYQWIPSNIWVGVGRMSIDQVRFKLHKVYKRWDIEFHQAKATAIHPEGDTSSDTAFVDIEYTSEDKRGKTGKVEYDYLVNATGPKLNFGGTEGLGPGQNTVSVCSYDHAAHAWEELEKSIEKMKKGEKQRFLIGTGHAMATCQGAAFEYALNIAFELKRRKLLHLAEITWISNEYEVGDFGMGGAFVKRGGYVTSTKVFTESVFAENNIKWIKRAGVYKIDPGKAYYETLDGEEKSIEFDFAMLIPGFSGQPFKAFDKQGEDITAKVFAPNGFMKVDADYTPKPFEEWSINDWPQTYQSPAYANMYATGIAFAPPHSISKPMKSPSGRAIFPAPPRTGMPSGVIGKIVAENIAEGIKKGSFEHKHTANMGRMGAACIVSAGYSLTKGLGATMTVSPVVPDWEKYPEWGRNINSTVGEIGTAGHWIKLFLHYMFLHKAKGYPFWWLLPE
ncbi:FAD/NAD(P)-binding oxidoreductase [Draconibacterium sp. IB214405]|uniref:NAD(P)/FAD-dependent oxidoreductase n=1 Tax=Draconibacterium sp. IB214405 TaxID=3097352 RepID=UPI002A11D998|nr:FAD/NAD(P)-binding oxidoreductase [Draconibacterium sp. IB214405]MDX8341109.1 FAD/NAD(P)-binding oxidoreductase [Draconibacterium sp. IB214405]